MVNAKEFFEGNFLKAKDCKGGEICEILADAEMSEIKSKEGKVKIVMNIPIKFHDKDKLFTPNQMNGNILVEAFGEETNKWVGRKFKIKLVETIVFGELTDSIVVEPLDVVPTEKVN